jgi:hypothetical protein
MHPQGTTDLRVMAVFSTMMNILHICPEAEFLEEIGTCYLQPPLLMDFTPLPLWAIVDLNWFVM